MLSYQHGYHAGNFADLMKHAILVQLLRYLTQKDKPLFYLETHAGRGLYDLHDKQARKTGEASDGIACLWQHKAHLPNVFSPYLELINQLNPTGSLRYYPGSPKIALDILRPIDRLVCCELHPTEHMHLKQLWRGGKRLLANETDGIAEMNALLPPKERRGLIFIDPSFEVKTEYLQIPAKIKEAYQRFSTGVYCLWYPLVDTSHHERLVRGLKSIPAKQALQIEFYYTTQDKPGMTGCGLWILNPPFVLEKEAKAILKGLCQYLNPGVSSYHIISYGDGSSL